jgi:hypothetical protein
MIEIKGVHIMQRLAITIAVIMGVLFTPAFSANSIATRINNGSKLMLKEGTDSLFYVYGNSSGAVKLASGVGGSWTEEQVVSLRDYPAIAADSTGKRWVAVRQSALQEGDLAVQEVYYKSGGSWIAETLYSKQGDAITIGPPSIAGASSTTTGVVYVAFRSEDKPWPNRDSIILTKYNGTTKASRKVVDASDLGDPAIAVEPYKTDSFIVHVTWEDGGVIKHAYCVDGTGSGIPALTTWVGTVSDPNEEAFHPSISADRGRVVIAWSQDSPPDVYARERLLGTWGLEANQSDSYTASDYATIALGDAVVVAWEEASSASDHDIWGHVDFARDITIHNCNAISAYPHVTLQPFDGTHLYLHTVWSEPDYAVGYNRIDLMSKAPKGPQSASSGEMLTQPSLAACLPNPFHGRTQMSYALPAAGNVTLQVYDATGRPVRTLANGLQNAGTHCVSWDARDTDGKQVPYGVYFYRLDTPGFRSVKKAVVAR